MNAARQVLRFSIPGAVLVLWILTCFAVYKRFQGVDVFSSAALVRENIGALLVLLVTVPVGFIVYQIYYFTYGPIFNLWPFRWSGRLVRVDRGAAVLHGLSGPRLQALGSAFEVKLDVVHAHVRVPDPGPWKAFREENPWYRYPVEKVFHWLQLVELTKDWKDSHAKQGIRKAYTRRWHHNWDALRGLIDIAGSYPRSSHIKHEYTIFSDVYHSLGATRTAVALAWGSIVAVSLTHVGRLEDKPLASLAGLALITAMSFAVSTVLHVARLRTWGSAASSLRFALRWLLREEEAESREPRLFPGRRAKPRHHEPASPEEEIAALTRPHRLRPLRAIRGSVKGGTE